MKIVTRRLFLLITYLSVVLVLQGCNSANDPSAKTVGISMPTKTIERWNRDGNYLKTLLEKQGYNVELRFADNNILHQINDIQVLIADDVDILFVVPIDGSTLSRTLEDAKIKNIPVISYDTLVMNSDAVDCYVSFDNYRVGALHGQYIVDSLRPDETDGTYNIELVTGDPADNNAKFFFRGAIDVLQPYIDSGKFIVPSGKTSFDQVSTPLWSMDLAFRNMQNTLASYYSDKKRLDAVMCSNDLLGLGVLNAIQSDYMGKNIPVVTGQDGDIAALRSIIDGKLSMTVYKNVGNEAKVAVSVATAILEGKAIDESLLKDLPAECVFDTESYDNGIKKVPSFLLVPETINAENIDTLTKDGAYVWDKNGKYLISAP